MSANNKQFKTTARRNVGGDRTDAPIRRSKRKTRRSDQIQACDAYDRIYSVITEIPEGKVATYGQIARLAGLPGRARQVGYALRVLPDDFGVPWHRVVNARGEISRRSAGGGAFAQRALLEAEGIEFDTAGGLALETYQWEEE
jgi:methylated-DNA-protein-cysteine methyltransferase-like protein